MSHFDLSPEQIKLFYKDGYLIVKEFCNKREVKKLYESANDEAMRSNNMPEANRTGNTQKHFYWYNLPNDVFGYLSRSEKMVKAVAQLLDGDSPVCHIKSNLLKKEPYVGGVWQWHQDYCYWYKNNFLFPDQLMNAMVTLTDMNKHNGCSQLIKGSHKLGRVNHDFEGSHPGADREVLNNSLQVMELVDIELEAGDAIFFHTNILHRSDANLSSRPLWSIISCYSSQSNVPYSENLKTWDIPVRVVPNDAILEWENETPQQAPFHNEESIFAD